MTDYLKTWHLVMYIKRNISELTHYQRLLAEIANHNPDQSLSDVIADTFLDGIVCKYEKDVRENKERDAETIIREENKKLDERMSKVHAAHKLYLRVGDEKFIELVGMVEAKELKEDFKLIQSEKKWTVRAYEFLCVVLNPDPLKIDDVKTLAIEEGIIIDEQRDWNRLKVEAHRRGFTKHHIGRGYWVLPSEIS